MGQDVADLVLEQPRIDRVQHRAQAWDGEEQLKMAVGVPGQGGHPVPRPHPQIDQRLGQLLAAAAKIGIAITDQIALDRARDDLALAVIGRRMAQYGRGRQRDGLHQSGDHRAAALP